jgi:hypothetical protein
MVGFLSLALVGASSSVGSPSLMKLVEIIEPYVACRADSDRKIVGLQHLDHMSLTPIQRTTN